MSPREGVKVQRRRSQAWLRSPLRREESPLPSLPLPPHSSVLFLNILMYTGSEHMHAMLT